MNNIQRLIKILAIAILALSWGLVALSFLLNIDSGLRVSMFISAAIATVFTLVLCAFAFAEWRLDGSSDGFDFDERSVNIDGTPMVGMFDMNGNMYGGSCDRLDSGFSNDWDSGSDWDSTR